jgi:hypothetical protein
VGVVLPDLRREMQEDGYLHLDRRWKLTYGLKTVSPSRKHPAFDLYVNSQKNELVKTLKLSKLLPSPLFIQMNAQLNCSKKILKLTLKFTLNKF